MFIFIVVNSMLFTAAFTTGLIIGYQMRPDPNEQDVINFLITCPEPFCEEFCD